jgi:hypothetical protein
MRSVAYKLISYVVVLLPLLPKGMKSTFQAAVTIQYQSEIGIATLTKRRATIAGSE